MKKALIFVGFSVFFGTVSFAFQEVKIQNVMENCKLSQVNTRFAQAGWEVRSTETFEEMVKELRASLVKQKLHFRKDLQSAYRSSILEAMVMIESYDDLRTPEGEAYGDVGFVWILDSQMLPDKVIEVRFYDAENQKRVVDYNSQFMPCATGPIPFGVNTIF